MFCSIRKCDRLSYHPPIVACRIEPGAENDMIYDSKEKLKAMIDSDMMYVDNIRGNLIVGNSHALEYARGCWDKDEFESRLASLERWKEEEH